MNNTIKNMAASVHSRLSNRARELGKPFGEMLQYYGIERFLFRLSKTQYGDRFILKGGLIFYAWGLPLRRPTRDIDLRGYIKNSEETLTEVIQAACICQVPDDGLIFHPESLKLAEIMPEADYTGIRAEFLATLGNAKIPIQLDISFTDEVVPSVQDVEYPILLAGMESSHLKGYSRESVISEKLHAIVHRAEINSRLKDFYDIWMLSQQFDFDGPVLSQAIETTFRRRATDIPTDLPIGLSDEYAKNHQSQWQGFMKKHRLTSPQIGNFVFVTEILRAFLLPPLQSLTTSQPFPFCWKAGKGWEQK